VPRDVDVDVNVDEDVDEEMSLAKTLKSKQLTHPTAIYCLIRLTCATPTSTWPTLSQSE